MQFDLFYNSLALSLMLFAIGMICVLIKRDAISILIGIELMLNAANLTFLSFAKNLGNLADASIIVLFIVTIAAAEAGVGLAIFINLYRAKGSIDADKNTELKDDEKIERYFD